MQSFGTMPYHLQKSCLCAAIAESSDVTGRLRSRGVEPRLHGDARVVRRHWLERQRRAAAEHKRPIRRRLLQLSAPNRACAAAPEGVHFR